MTNGPFLVLNNSCSESFNSSRYSKVLSSQPAFFRFANACQSFLPCKSFVKTMALDLAVKPIPLNHCCKAFGFFNDPAFRQNFPAVLRSVDHKPSICPSGPAYAQFLLEPHKDKTFVLSFLCVGVFLSSQDVAVQVFSAPVSLTSVFGMGTGGPSPLSTPTIRNSSSPFRSFSHQASCLILSVLHRGAPTGTRTRDTLIKSQVLYQLSYWCKSRCSFESSLKTEEWREVIKET